VRGLDHGDGAGGTDLLGEHGGEQADAAVEVPGAVAGAAVGPVADDLGEGVRGGRVHLPEAVGAEVPGAAGGQFGGRAAALAQA
jgi:hypothetical protein